MIGEISRSRSKSYPGTSLSPAGALLTPSARSLGGEGADIYQIAKNCRSSAEIIEEYYAAHIKTSLDAAAISVMREKRNKVEENDVETPAQAQTGDEETDV